MSSFNYGGQTYEILDIDVLSSAPRRIYTENQSLYNCAEEELDELESWEKQRPFMNVYFKDGFTYHTGDTSKSMQLCLVGLDYTYPRHIKVMYPCNAMVVFYRQGEAFRLLWTVRRFAVGATPVFLNKTKLTEAMLNIFSKTEIRLGELQTNGTPSIAWEIATEKGRFYVPWHNGCMVEQSDETEFSAKPFNEMKGIYKILRFTECLEEKNTYRILLA